MKKILSAILVIAMLCSMLAGLTVYAYTEISILATDFSLTVGEYQDTSPNSFDQTWYVQKYFPVEVYSGNYGTFGSRIPGNPVPLLSGNKADSIKQGNSCLMAGAFFCSFDQNNWSIFIDIHTRKWKLNVLY